MCGIGGPLISTSVYRNGGWAHRAPRYCQVNWRV